MTSNSFFPREAEHVSDYADLFAGLDDSVMNELDALRAELAELKSMRDRERADYEADIREATQAIKDVAAVAMSTVGQAEKAVLRVQRRNWSVDFLSSFINGAFGGLGAGVGFGARRAAYRR